MYGGVCLPIIFTPHVQIAPSALPTYLPTYSHGHSPLSGSKSAGLTLHLCHVLIPV